MRGILEAWAEELRPGTPHEVTLVQQTLAEAFFAEPIKRLIGDNAYDSDRPDQGLALAGVEMIAPHRSIRRNLTRDGRSAATVAGGRSNACLPGLQNYRRLVVRWEYRIEAF
jgi:hypothetical protein